MIAVVVSLVAVVLLVLVVVALGMRSMNRRESSLPPERLKEMAEKEEMTHARSTDEFAAHEPRMANFSPDFSPIDEPKPKPVRTGQRGRRGVDEWGNPPSDDDDEEFWANIRSDAEEGGFGAGGTVAARKGASRPVDREREPERAAERPVPKRPQRAKPQPAAASADPNAATVQAPLPQRQPSPAAAGLADLVEPAAPPAKRTPSQADMADQRTVTFAAPTADVMSILGAGAQPVPAPTRSEPPATRPAPVSSSNGVSSNAAPRSVSSNSVPSSGSYPAAGSGSYPAYPAGDNGYTPAASSGSYPATPAANGAFPAPNPASSGNFPAAQPAPIHGAPSSDPFPAYNGAADALETTWTNTPPAGSQAAWPTPPDILDDPAPAGTPYGGASSWPAFEQPADRSSYPASYEVRSGWAVADDSDPLTGSAPVGTPTVPGRAVSAAYDDVLSAPAGSTPTPPSPFGMGAYETGDITTAPAAAWPEPPSGNGGQGGRAQGNSGSHRRSPEQDYPHDYYR